jgi:hypothetical protein
MRTLGRACAPSATRAWSRAASRCWTLSCRLTAPRRVRILRLALAFPGDAAQPLRVTLCADVAASAGAQLRVAGALMAGRDAAKPPLKPLPGCSGAQALELRVEVSAAEMSLFTCEDATHSPYVALYCSAVAGSGPRAVDGQVDELLALWCVSPAEYAAAAAVHGTALALPRFLVTRVGPGAAPTRGEVSLYEVSQLARAPDGGGGGARGYMYRQSALHRDAASSAAQRAARAAGRHIGGALRVLAESPASCGAYPWARLTAAAAASRGVDAAAPLDHLFEVADDALPLHGMFFTHAVSAADVAGHAPP